jgi:acetyl-CoA carboxylase, biotin carboxylase subunit
VGRDAREAILRMRRALEEYKHRRRAHEHPLPPDHDGLAPLHGGQYDTRFVEERFSMEEAEGKPQETSPPSWPPWWPTAAQRAAQIVQRNERDTSNWKWVGRWERMHR